MSAAGNLPFPGGRGRQGVRIDTYGPNKTEPGLNLVVGFARP
jgi:hypothetical protein